MKILLKKFGERLDKLLADKLTDWSRSRIQKAIKTGEIKINNNSVTPHYRVKAGDDIVLIKKTEEKKTANKPSALPKFRVIADEKNYLIINKPAGVITHGAPHIKIPTLVEALLKKYPKLIQVGEEKIRAAIVHRLDKEASGLMIIPKNNKTFDYLKQQFALRKIKKRYTVLVHGALDKDEGEINFPLARSTTGHKMAARPRTDRGELNTDDREALTEFRVIKKFVNYTLLKVDIKTGRTHQIRAHLAAYCYPVVGDDLYGTRKTKELNKKLSLGRIFLIADYLGFFDLAKNWQEFKINLPRELKEALTKIK